MSRHEARGTKRRCQNEECALPFYDLNRVDYACPTCGAAFDVRLIGRGAAIARPAAAHVAAAAVPAPIEPVEPEQGEDGEPPADAAEATEEAADDGDQTGDLILEQDDGDDDGIVVGPMPEGRAED